MAVHVVKTALVNVDATGAVFRKTDASIAQVMNSGTELRVLPDAGVPNSANHPRVADYLVAEDASGFTFQHMDQHFIITYEASSPDMSGMATLSSTSMNLTHIDCSFAPYGRDEYYPWPLNMTAASTDPADYRVIYQGEEQEIATVEVDSGVLKLTLTAPIAAPGPATLQFLNPTSFVLEGMGPNIGQTFAYNNTEPVTLPVFQSGHTLIDIFSADVNQVVLVLGGVQDVTDSTGIQVTTGGINNPITSISIDVDTNIVIITTNNIGSNSTISIATTTTINWIDWGNFPIAVVDFPIPPF